jgi:purine-binding chemotaxis protein CheW
MPTATLPVPTKSERAEDSATHQYLTFSLGGESFAVLIESVREIIEFDGMTPIPMTPDFLRGVINLRGAVVPVIDLWSRFGRGETATGKRTCFVIVEVEHDEAPHPLGIMVDAVNEVVTVDRAQIEDKPSFGTRLRSDFVDGILNLEGKFVVTLDIRQVLSIEEMAELAGAVAGVPAEEFARA